MNPRVILNSLCVVLGAVGATMLVPAVFSVFARDGTFQSFALPALASGVACGVGFALTRRKEASYVSSRDVFVIVVLGWTLVAAIGSLPFILTGVLGPVDSLFDSMAGFTTTGASTLLVPEDAPPSILLWRSITQWAGGIGIIVLFVAIAPIIGFGATQLYAAEMPNPTQERLTPRIQDTAKVLTYIYLTLTVGGFIALTVAGMSPFDAVNHALSTVSTGGFSTRSDSIAAFDSVAVELSIVAGMILSGTNFGLYFLAIQGRLSQAFRSPELLAYVGIIAAATLIMTLSLFIFDYQDSLGMSLREALFQSASLSTGTAFQTADWKVWDPLSQCVLMVLMAVGGCAGSTSGGIKIVRAVVLAKNAAQDTLRMLHPRAVTPLRLGQRVIPERLRQAVLGFLFIYATTLAVGTLLLSAHQVPVGQSFGAVFSCVNITGTALGPVGNASFYEALPGSAKGILAVLMLMGRLELLTVIIIFTPAFWRR